MGKCVWISVTNFSIKKEMLDEREHGLIERSSTTSSSILTDHKTCNPRKNLKANYGFLSILSLITGMFLYLLFRDFGTMIIFTWVPKPVLAGTVLILLKPSLFTDFLMYNLPDALWFLSGILFFRFIWFEKVKIQKAYLLSFYVIGAIFEISQLSEKVPGTFDLLDLFFMGLGAFVEGLLYNTYIKRRLV